MGLTTKEIFRGYHTTGVCIMSPFYFCVSLEQSEEQARFNKGKSPWSRWAVHDLEQEKGSRWGKSEFEGGWVSPILVHTMFDEYLAVDRVGDVFYCGLGSNKQCEKPLTPYQLGIFGLKNINGTIYGVAPSRSVYQRLGVNSWQLHEQLRNIPGAQQASRKGFDDIDGFSEQDMYAVGGDRDVWHFDGEYWSPLDISSRPFICTCVVCAEDGYVYIGGRYGAIARGRGDEWTVYYPEEAERDIQSIVSYRGRVFAGTEGHTFIIGEDLIPQRYDFESQLAPIAGKYMYAAYDRLLIANNYNQVAFFDGEKWLNINGCNEMTEQEARLLMQHNMELMEKAQKHLGDLMDIVDKASKK